MFRKNKVKLLILTIFCFTGLHAQDLNLIEKSGLQTPVSISNVRSILFKSGNLNVNLRTGVPINKVLNSVRSIHFPPITGINNPLQTSITLHLFPNPTHDFINLDYQTDEINDINLKVISIDGRVLYTEILKDKSVYSHKIDISTWQRGLYFVILNDGKTMISKKIIKN